MNLFTSEELYVLAALLGKEFIIGVEGATLEDNRSDLDSMFERYFSGLKSKGVFEYEIDGTLSIDHEVVDLVNVLNKAEEVFVVASDFQGKKERTKYMRYGDLYYKLSDKDALYSTNVLNGFSYDSILESYGICIPNGQLKKISIFLNDLKSVDELYKTFNNDEADDYLSNLLHDTEVETLIRKCLIKKADAFIIKEYKRFGSHLTNVNELILRFVDDYVLKFSINGLDSIIVSIYRKE